MVIEFFSKDENVDFYIEIDYADNICGGTQTGKSGTIKTIG